MIKLKNIMIDENLVRCDIYPENSVMPGYVVVDYNTKELKEYKLPSGFEWCKNHVYHAMKKMIEVASEKKDLKECTVMWY